MTWKNLLSQGRVEPHATSKAELADLRTSIERNLKDAAIDALSDDNRFAIAYQAALLAAKMAVACAGFRVKGTNAHQTTFAALKLAVGPKMAADAEYLDRCRRKRNVLIYDAAGLVSHNDTVELVNKAEIIYTQIDEWITQQFPHLA